MSTPTGTVSSTTVSTNTGEHYLDALLDGGKYTVSNLTYSFANSNSVYIAGYQSNEPTAKFNLTVAQQSAVRDALQVIADVVNLTFTEVTDSASVAGDLRFAGYTNMGADAYAWAYTPGNYAEAGDVWVSADMGAVTSWTQGTYEFATVLHEVGHALGLKHSFEGSKKLPASEESNQYTQMSYTARADNLFWDGVSGSFSTITPDTLMLPLCSTFMAPTPVITQRTPPIPSTPPRLSSKPSGMRAVLMKSAFPISLPTAPSTWTRAVSALS